MQLIYRGQILPYTLNWRLQAPGESYSEIPTPIAAYRKPQAINWRWQ